VTAAEADAAIQRIIDRHRAVDDPDLWQLDRDPANVLVYLQRHRGGLPRSVIEADLLDGFVLRVRLWWLGEEAELWLLERAHRLQVPPRRIGKLLGVRSRQGVHDRLRLARAKIARLRGEAPMATLKGPDQDKHAREARWIDRHRSEVLAVAQALVAHRDLLDVETAEWVVEIARDLRDDVVTPGSVQLIRFALADLASSAVFNELAIDHDLRAADTSWSALYASYPGEVE
jgi:hypothetical protein